MADRSDVPRSSLQPCVLDAPSSWIGRVVSHYRILEHLGGGGMGVVFRALDTKLRREVALKFLPPEISHLKEAKERFIQEARAASGLDHPNICTIYEIGQTSEGQLFLAMAYSEGLTLKERLGAGPLTVAEVVSLAEQVAAGLAASHASRIIHRDIKPSNVWLTRLPGDDPEESPKRVRILDFGLAKVLGQSDLTRTGSSMGTPAYMSPEHARGLRVDPRTDLWSLGVMIYEALTGTAPFTGPNIPAVMFALLSNEPQPLRDLRPDVPVELERIVARLMRKEPEERYPSCQELLIDLRQVPRVMAEVPSPPPPSMPSLADHTPAVSEPLDRTAPLPEVGVDGGEVGVDETPLSGIPSITPRLNPSEDPSAREFDELIAKGLGAALARDYRCAAEAFEAALRLRPGDSRAQFNLEKVRGRLVERR